MEWERERQIKRKMERMVRELDSGSTETPRHCQRPNVRWCRFSLGVASTSVITTAITQSATLL
jgi:hypothetical protein